MPTIVGILTFMRIINFMLGSVEHDKSSGPGIERLSTFNLECVLVHVQVLQVKGLLNLLYLRRFDRAE